MFWLITPSVDFIDTSPAEAVEAGIEANDSKGKFK